MIQRLQRTVRTLDVGWPGITYFDRYGPRATPLDSMRAILHPYDPLIFGMIRRFRIREQDFEDAAQECRLALIEQPDYAPRWVVMQRLGALVKAQMRFRRRQPLMAATRPPRRVIDPDARLDAETLLAMLPARWAGILRRQSQGWSQAEIAAVENVAVKRVEKLAAKARERLRA